MEIMERLRAHPRGYEPFPGRPVQVRKEKPQVLVGKHMAVPLHVLIYHLSDVIFFIRSTSSFEKNFSVSSVYAAYLT